nr:hypothetical protein CFP56_37350 [Quercus suber]
MTDRLRCAAVMLSRSPGSSLTWDDKGEPVRDEGLTAHSLGGSLGGFFGMAQRGSLSASPAGCHDAGKGRVIQASTSEGGRGGEVRIVCDVVMEEDDDAPSATMARGGPSPPLPPNYPRPGFLPGHHSPSSRYSGRVWCTHATTRSHLDVDSAAYISHLFICDLLWRSTLQHWLTSPLFYSDTRPPFREKKETFIASHQLYSHEASFHHRIVARITPSLSIVVQHSIQLRIRFPTVSGASAKPIFVYRID